MNNCEIEGLRTIQSWFVGHTNEKPDRVIVKRYDKDRFVDSIIVPSAYYPLSGKYEVFNYTNTHQIGLAEDDVPIIEIFNSIKAQIGMCYYNAEAVTRALCNAGYPAKTYVGWLLSPNTPIHHAWTVLYVGDRPSVLDLSDHHVVASEYYHPCKSMDEQRKMIAAAEKKIAKLPNHEQCFPLGIPSPIWYYVGCPSNKDEGINLYRNLCAKYPNHPAAPQTVSGLTPTQAMMLSDMNK